jgi:hypothetical protein
VSVHADFVFVDENRETRAFLHHRNADPELAVPILEWFAEDLLVPRNELPERMAVEFLFHADKFSSVMSSSDWQVALDYSSKREYTYIIGPDRRYRCLRPNPAEDEDWLEVDLKPYGAKHVHGANT